MTIGLFEVREIAWQTLTISLTKLLKEYGLKEKIIAYVKDEGFNFNAMTVTLKSNVSCESFGLKESLQGTFFGHVFS